jgi:hypothetical protein
MKTNKKLILKEGKNRKEIFDDIDRVDAAYRKNFKKAPSFELFFSESGTVKQPKFELTAYYAEENKKDLDFVISILSSKN